MKALKLKLAPTDEQYKILDEMFKKWASICTRMSRKNASHEAFNPPEDAKGIWFSKTQLNQAQTDIQDLKGALQRSAEQKQREFERTKRRRDEILSAIKDETLRDNDIKRPKNFRPKLWVEHGLLKTKNHTLNYWQSEIKKLERIMDKKQSTIEKIRRGRIVLKPKRITLHQNSFLLSFGGKKVILKPFHKSNKILEKLELQLITEPIQPLIGLKGGKSSCNSGAYLTESMCEYLAYAIHSMFFGMNRAEEMLLKAKNLEKVTKKNAKIKKKKESFNKKRKNLEKILCRSLRSDELEIMSKEFIRFFDALESTSNSSRNEDYSGLIRTLSNELKDREEAFSVNKYPILIRKPINQYKTKKITNLKPKEWKYYIQFSYEPMKINRIEPQTIMGIDRGLTHLLALAIYDSKTEKFIINRLVDNPISGWKWKLRKMKNSLQHLERRMRAQKGVHLYENQMKKNLKSIENRVENLYHNISSQIINLAKEYKSVIVLENLERGGLKQHGRKKGKYLRPLNYALSLFDYAKIATLIKYKAEYSGIYVYDVLPAGTSQNCAKCIIDRGQLTVDEETATYTRDSQNKKIGKCTKHGQIDADLNAARVIAVCYHKNLNQPMVFGQRKTFKVRR